MIRYNNISRPVHDSNDPWRPSLRPPCPKSGGHDPQLPGLPPLDSNGKEAFSRRKELPMGVLSRMKMAQEKNGENTDLKCDLVLCRNKDYEKGGHHWKPLYGVGWRRSAGQSTGISNEMLKLVAEERSLLTTIRTRQWNWMGHIMTGGSLQREIIEGRMDCK